MSSRNLFSLLVCFTLIALTTTIAADKLKVGDKAPDFTLPYATKDTLVEALRLSDVIGKNNIILAFYPADWSGGCTKEMCTLRDNFSALSELGAVVYGISGDYIYTHREWARHHNLQFALLSDHSHDVARTYASYNPDTGFNLRTVYVVDRKGNIAYIDLAYKAGTPDSFEKLKAALTTLK
ncbi:MAG: redoxin domain-containing protein [Bacteroidota bacterium]